MRNLNIALTLVLAGCSVSLPTAQQAPAEMNAEAVLDQACDQRSIQTPFGFEKPIVIGEFHGTEQSAPFVTSMVCSALLEGSAVTLAVEMPQVAVEDALGVATENTFWRSEYPDGRASAATREMLSSLSGLSRAGLVKVVGFIVDGEPVSEANSADRIRNGTRPGDTLIVLAGSYHARRPAIGSSDETLTVALGDVVNVRIANSQQGAAWACVPECGVQVLNGSTGNLPLAFSAVAAANGFDYYYVVQTFTPSSPY